MFLQVNCKDKTRLRATCQSNDIQHLIAYERQSNNVQFGKGSYLDIRYFSGFRETQSVDDNRCDIIGLNQFFRTIRSAFRSVYRSLHGTCRSSIEDTEDPNTVRVYFLPETVCNGFESVLGRGILADVRFG